MSAQLKKVTDFINQSLDILEKIQKKPDLDTSNVSFNSENSLRSANENE